MNSRADERRQDDKDEANKTNRIRAQKVSDFFRRCRKSSLYHSAILVAWLPLDVVKGEGLT